MRILILTQIVPYPPDSGPRVKTYHVLRYLSSCGHEVTLASFVRDPERTHLKTLQTFCKRIYSVRMSRSRIADLRAYATNLRSPVPFIVTRDASRDMQDLIMKMVDQEFDIVQADQLTMAQFALLFRRSGSATHRRPFIVFDAHNAVYEIVARAQLTAPFFLRPALLLEARRLREYEGSLIHQFDRTLAVSEVDKSALLSAATKVPQTKADLVESPDHSENLASKISVIPIAVDSDALQPINRCDTFCNIITVSTLFYPPNADGVRWFAREVFPLVRRQVPDAHLTIVGPRPPRDLVNYGKKHADYVHVTGYVPDLLPYLERASLMIVPVRVGSGMRVRILEAMARGIAIVSTTTGAEGIDVVNGEHLLIADKPAEFADAVVRLLKDWALAESLAKNGRRLAVQKYDWRVVLPSLDHIYEAIGSN